MRAELVLSHWLLGSGPSVRHKVLLLWEAYFMGGGRQTAVLLSGGIDSAVVLALLHANDWSADAIFVDFGQRAAEQECSASQHIAEVYRVPWERITIGPLRTKAFAEVPGRNDLLLAIAGAARPSSHVAIGVHAGTPYVDCSRVHADAWQSLFDLEYGGGRRLITPLVEFTKDDVVETARVMRVPLELTWSCEDADGPCGACRSCRDRSIYAGPQS